MIDVVRRQIERALAGLRMPFRGRVESIDTSKPVQRVNATGLVGEELPAIELFQQYGFTSAPPAGADVIVAALGGRTSASVIVATEFGQYRLVVSEGEAALYSRFDNAVHLKADGSVVVRSPIKVTLDAPLVECTQNLKVGGNIDAGGEITDQSGTPSARSMSGMRTVFDGHNHTEHDGPITSHSNQSM